MNRAIHYAELADSLARLGYPQDAAEYHGALCGALCVASAGDIDVRSLLHADEAAASDPAAQETLERLRDESVHALEDLESSFTPLLPDDETDLASRTRALAVWCEGFLFGLSSRDNLDLKKASAEVREVVSDLVEFSHASTAGDEGEEADVEENAYAEIVEYVRVGAQLIFVELHPRGAAAGDDASQIVVH